VALGDSLTEGLGVAKEQAYPALLEKKIHDAHKDWVVVNAGVSGSTSASGPGRLKWLLKTKIDLLILALGANDGLRGLSIENTKSNLAETIELAQKNGVTVVLAGMLMPPNYGKEYTQKFEQVFKILSVKYKIHLIPFLLDKVGGEAQFNQTDGMHPNAKGHEIVADNVYSQIKNLL
jgi:acyl-CoA thioesterase-1